jgi:isopenicillin-N N-acyltransferase-like protein
MPELAVVRAEGNPQDRGLVVGGALGEQIEAQLAFHRVRLAQNGWTGTDVARALAPYLAAAEAGFPDFVCQLRAMSQGSGADFTELFAMNALEELEAPIALERCTSVTVRTAETTILAHNEQWYAGDAGLTALVIEHPATGTAIASPTSACYLPAVGMNAHGAAQGVDSLTASDDGVGIPRVFVSRHALEAADRGEAVARAGEGGRSGGYAHVYAFPGGDTLTVETTARQVAVVEGPGVHTNHYLDAGLAELGDAPSPTSVGRRERMIELLATRAPETIEDVMELMRDHAALPQAICLHPADSEGLETDCVVFSMVCDVGARRMWVANGTPCSHPYEEVDVADVFQQ